MYCCDRFNLNDPHDGLYAISERCRKSILHSRIDQIKRLLKDKGTNVDHVPELDLLKIIEANADEKFFYEIFHNDKGLSLFNICSFSTHSLDELMWAHYADNFRGVCLEFDFNEDTEISNLFNRIVYTDDMPEVDNLVREEFLKAYSTKRKKWEYECEYRLITDGRQFVPFQPLSLKRILFGPRVPKLKIETVKKLCHHLDLQHVKFDKVDVKVNGVVVL